MRAIIVSTPPFLWVIRHAAPEVAEGEEVRHNNQ